MKDAATMKAELKKLIDTAAGRIPADLVIKNCKVVNVFSGKIQEGDIAFSGDQIAGIGAYEGKEAIDAEGRYLLTAISISNLLMYVRRRSDVSLYRMVEQRSWQTHMRS